MPLVRRRHYSWPFSGPSTNAYSRDIFSDTNISKQKLRCGNTLASTTIIDNMRQSNFLDDVYNEDTLSAGIVPSSKNLRSPRLWRSATSNVIRRPERERTTGWDRDAERGTEVVISTITQANELPTAVLRRLIWPRFEKTRLHTSSHRRHYHHSSSHTLTSSSLSEIPPPKKTQVFVTITRSVTTPSQVEDGSQKEKDNSDGALYNAFDDREVETEFYHVPTVDLQFQNRLHHRRCHSAQPRAWQEPSPGLWTLLEE
jgi:hypothetical protein